MLGDEFRADPQGRRYADVLAMPSFALVLAFFDDRGRQRRMIESEEHHDRPALAGVVREFEKDGRLRTFFDGLSLKEGIRVRQAVGVVVRLVMNKHGWTQTGKRGSLTGLSKWFSRSERYEDLIFE
jgi:hypothetical protein